VGLSQALVLVLAQAPPLVLGQAASLPPALALALVVARAGAVAVEVVGERVVEVAGERVVVMAAMVSLGILASSPCTCDPQHAILQQISLQLCQAGFPKTAKKTALNSKEFAVRCCFV
jgi:hypothetical protein